MFEMFRKENCTVKVSSLTIYVYLLHHLPYLVYGWVLAQISQDFAQLLCGDGTVPIFVEKPE